ncbi:penicillin acylase family protein [Haloferax sp. MBLA0076]|uniref:Penicillin acylase family protein n=1 Tax=Haloferax litoreum TaxID=2666140 RepID=A0A6A8GJ01_9EURY|nr:MULTISPECIES: penicillin acylase family protein [Haloferax]KAB1194640.1 penicillin acylase family protein [Haloferax sp. CBA1148]MRX23218.1 penicillin acylase family protein [Haloferax litoreum]
MNTTTRAAVAVVCTAALVATSVLGGSFLGLAAPLSGDLYESAAPEGATQVDSPYGPASVWYDDDGVPHIDAENEEALYFAVGYVQARDRLFQMDLQRRLVGGELSAVVGESTLESDRFYRSLDFQSAAEASWQSVRGTEVGTPIEAFTAGVNHYAGTGPLPPEYALLDAEFEAWTPTDTLLVGKLISWQLSGSFADLRRATAVSRLGTNATELYPATLDHDVPIIRDPAESDAAPFSPADVVENASATNANVGGDFGALAEWTDAYDKDPTYGSNNWVVSGEHTASGRPLLANDPHLALTVPPVWYEMHLSTDQMDVRGVGFPGIPMVVIGRTADAAWGVTNVGGDFTDLYTYEMRDGGYVYEGEVREFDTETETIEVADGENVEIAVRKSVHGPVIERGGRTVGVAWPGFSATNESLGVYRLNHADSVDDIQDALRIWDVPAQNFVAADRAGNTLYYPAGQYPIRVTDGEVVRGDTIFDGSAGEGEWRGYEPYGQSSWDGFVPFESIPHVENPDVLATANQRTIDGPAFYMGTSLTYADPYRGQRIYDLLDDAVADGDVTVETMQQVQRDVRSEAATGFSPYATSSDAVAQMSPGARELSAELEGWDGQMRADSRAALVYRIWVDEFRTATFADEFEPQGMDDSYYPRLSVLQRLDADSQWYDNRSTLEHTETRADISAQAMNRTADRLDEEGWETYGDFNTLDMNHPFDREFTNYPERPMNGSRFTVFNFRSAGSTQAGSSWRMVVDFSDEDDSLGVIPGGQRGVFWSSHYHDQLDEWADGEYKALTLDRPSGSPDIVFGGGQ